ncbi:MAG: helix-turn-helix domain-containing protein [Myxococcaceae bacterium]|nr:helix-turn-helix domain-containing protein [Myxococcaceae bacterium]
MDSPLLHAVGRRVRDGRKARGLTAKALAAAAGLSERFVGELEAGRANISVLNLEAVAHALGLELTGLVRPVTPPPQVIALLGLRGAGKSTVGRALGERLGLPFLELDQLVEREAGMRLPEIFAIHGEDYFRAQELKALRRCLADHPRAVLAAGGGLVASPEAYRLLLEQTRTVWLKATPAEHWARVVKQGDLRPMQNRPHAMAELKRRLEERDPLYRQAQLQLSTSRRPVPALVDAIASWAEA